MAGTTRVSQLQNRGLRNIVETNGSAKKSSTTREGGFGIGTCSLGTDPDIRTLYTLDRPIGLIRRSRGDRDAVRHYHRRLSAGHPNPAALLNV